MQLIILAVAIQGISIRFEEKKVRFSFRTVTADTKKSYLEDLANTIKNYGGSEGV